MYRILILTFMFALGAGFVSHVQAGAAPGPTIAAEAYRSASPVIEKAPKAKWHHRLAKKWKRFSQSKAGKYFKAFLLFAAIGTGLYILGTFIAAGTILTGVISTTTLAELISGGLYIGAYVCYLYSLYTGIAALITWILGSADIG